MSIPCFFSLRIGHQKVVPSLLCQHCEIVSSSKTSFLALASSFFPAIYLKYILRDLLFNSLVVFFFLQIFLFSSLFSSFFSLPRLKHKEVSYFFTISPGKNTSLLLVVVLCLFQCKINSLLTNCTGVQVRSYNSLFKGTGMSLSLY